MDICEVTTYSYDKINRHPWELARIKVVENILKPICSGKLNLNILDIGCGDVFVAQELSKSFPTISFHCVDIAFTDEIKKALKNRIAKFPIAIYSSLDELKSKDKFKKANVILLLDVVEHIEDEVTFMKYLKDFSFVEKDTVFLITVPAFQSLYSNHDVFLKHFRRYNLKLLNNKMHSAGYRVIKSGYFFSSLLILRYIQKLLQRNKNIDGQKGIGKYKSKGFIDVLLLLLLFIDYIISKLFRVVKIKLPGLSCYTICQQQ